MAVKWMPGLLEFSRLLKNSPKLLEEAKRSPMAKYTFELIDRLYQVFALPGIRRIHPWTKAEKNRVYAIPVFKSLERGNIERDKFRVQNNMENKNWISVSPFVNPSTLILLR
jgi:hypothetical protein